MSGYAPIEGNGGTAPKAVSRRDAGRIELTAVSGMRFFATFSLVCGRAIEVLIHAIPVHFPILPNAISAPYSCILSTCHSPW